MRIIYCDSVVDPKMIEPDYEAERKAAHKAGFQSSLISFEELEEGNLRKALRFVHPVEQEELAVYRGWMMRPEQYEQLYQGLLQKNIRLINDPHAYKHCHHLPESYEKIKSKTPETVWTNSDTENIKKALLGFGAVPLIVKDYVKSEKHHWEEACFIPDASSTEAALAVVNKFLELRGSFLNEGLVFRRFEELTFLTEHSKSAMPLTKEFRTFFVNQNLMQVFKYWEEGDYGETQAELTPFLEMAASVESNFFTMDIAQKKDGEWIIMELGDGQVAGLPPHADTQAFYNRLKECIQDVSDD